MAQKNLEITMKRYASGTRIEFTLYDGAGTVNLDGWGLKLRIKKGSSMFLDEDATAEANQTTTGKGKGFYQFTPTQADTITKGDYKVEVKGTAPDGKEYYWPTRKDPIDERRYGILTVYDPLAQ